MLGTIYLAQRDEPPTVTTEVFPENESDRTSFLNFSCKIVLPDGEAVDCPWLIDSTSKMESVAITAKF